MNNAFFDSTMTSPTKTLVIYHADCLDGLAAAWSAFCHWGAHARYIPARFGEPIPHFNEGDTLYIVDFCYPPEQLLAAANKAAAVFVIDHHLLAMEQCNTFFNHQTCPENLSCCFDMTQSGCVLVWRRFFPNKAVPKILQHIEDRDLWRFQFEDTKAITTALYEQMPLSFEAFGALDLNVLRADGQIQVAQFSRMVQRIAKSAYPIRLSGHNGLAVNAPSFFASELGHFLAEQSQTFGMTYHYDGKKKRWLFALRSVGDFDVGHIALHFGGGGHIHSAGFSLAHNPFLSSQSGLRKKTKRC